jgi:hypothetical protein
MDPDPNKYLIYETYVGRICHANDLTSFKSNPNYTYMLEHVTPEQGNDYLSCIQSSTSISISEVYNFCALNDAVGSPSKTKYKPQGVYIDVSPSSLRYIFQAHLILTHMKNIGNFQTDIVEVGGGYGGLCVAIHYFAPNYGISINSYRLCDLSNIIRLQTIYLDTVLPDVNIEFVNAESYGEHISCSNIYLVSNYCFSEISDHHRLEYQKKLFNKVSHGFMAWNHIPVYNFGFEMYVTQEVPYTAPHGNTHENKYVYF